MSRDGGISSLSTSARERSRQSPEATAAELRARRQPAVATPTEAQAQLSFAGSEHVLTLTEHSRTVTLGGALTVKYRPTCSCGVGRRECSRKTAERWFQLHTLEVVS